MTFEIRRCLTSDRAAVLAMSVTEAQSAFVEPLAETLSEGRARRDNFVIQADGAVVGFFQIDSASGEQAIAGCLELHELSIDARHQDKGYGKALMRALKPFLRKAYPEWAEVCLTVNCRNEGAYRLYRLGGFLDTGELRRQGRSGPQNILRLPLA